VSTDRYVACPDPPDPMPLWTCLTCDRLARKQGYSHGTASKISNRDRHDAWHEEQVRTCR
jgi:hypothetical protein